MGGLVLPNISWSNRVIDHLDKMEKGSPGNEDDCNAVFFV